MGDELDEPGQARSDAAPGGGAVVGPAQQRDN